MKRIFTFALVLLLVFGLTGCAAVKKLERENRQLTQINADLKAEVARLESAKKENETKLKESQGQAAKLEEEKKSLHDQVARLIEEVREMKKQRFVEQPLTNGEGKKATDQRADAAHKAAAPETAASRLSKPLKIKVLAGDGSMVSARRISDNIIKMGYSVESIGIAPRSNFESSTVYFKPATEKEGKQIAARLGSNTVSKPLTWETQFDLIVVSGKK